MSTSGARPIPRGPGTDQGCIPSPQDHDKSSRTLSPVQPSPGSSSTAFSDHFDRVRPTCFVNRYERTAKLEPPFIRLEIDPITTDFGDGNEPEDWTRLVHPEGALYWVHKHQQGEREMPIYTDAFLCDTGILEDVENFRDAILRKTAEANGRIPAQWELVLDLREDERCEYRICYYYFVNCSNRTLFWLHEYSAMPFLQGLFMVTSKRRIKQAMESLYWAHWEVFPHNRDVPQGVLKELVGIMIHAGVDDMTSHQSTSVYTGEHLQQFISYVKEIEFVGGADGYSACVVGRLMTFFTQGRYINFFGQREARLSADQSVFRGGEQKKRTWLITTTSFLFFFAPEAHLDALDNVYTDFVVCQRKWIKFIQGAQNEWRELVRISTVLLTANVAFLAIPSVDNPLGTLRNPAQVTSFVSMVFSMGCMVSGQLLVRHHMLRPHDSADQVDRYLRSHHDPHRGLETLAILFSLPQSLLLWAIAFFFVAFVVVALVDSPDRWQPTATVMILFFVLISWCAWTTWEGRARYVARWYNAVRRRPTCNRPPCQYPPPQPVKDQPERHDDRETTQINLS